MGIPLINGKDVEKLNNNDFRDLMNAVLHAESG
jgi:hypothetical protein